MKLPTQKLIPKSVLILGTLCLLASLARSATFTIYTNNFESYTNVATSEASTQDTDPDGTEWNIVDDTALTPTTAGAGVQVINWLTNAAGGLNQALLLRPNSEAQIFFPGPRSGSRYQLDFNAYIGRGPTSSQSFYVILRGEGSDINGDDYLAYRTDRTTNSSALFYFDAVGPGTAAFQPVATNHLNFAWQHHRMVFDANAMTFTLYIDDMVNPVLANADISRCEIGVPTLVRLVNEANSADDGYWALDDFVFTVDGSRDLSTTFTDGFEGYISRVNPDDDADPAGPWVTTEVDGTGQGRVRAPGKVQVVNSSVVTPHSGTNCLKVEAGQRAGASFAWGVSPQSDVQITWWARIPEANQSSATADAVLLRMSLYGAEGGNTVSGDSALLGYGIRRQSNTNCGDASAVLYFTTAWFDTGVDYTPNVWEEYRLTTHNAQGKYTIIKNPSSANPVVIADRAGMIGGAINWGPTFMAAWSSSNGTNHPPAYVDDIEIKSLVANADPQPIPYTITYDGTRFSNSTAIALSGPVGAVAVDPRDTNTILFTVDAATGGVIGKATKIAAGNWALDPVPIVTGLANPSGLTVAKDGTLWWTHDFSQALMRLKWPWSANSPEQVISDFALPGSPGGSDDDPFDIVFAPANFNGTLGQSNMLVLMDRGVDADANNALFLVDPTTTTLGQTGYTNYLFGPSATALGGADLVGLTALPASAEVATMCVDGQVTAVNADGLSRSFFPDFYSNPFISIAPAGIAADPLTGRIWIPDDLTNEVWSCAGDGTAGQRELSFPLTNPNRPDQQIDFHEPGIVFSQDGKFMVLTDASTSNGGGRLLIFHNEVFTIPPFSITNITRTLPGVQISWATAGAVRYDVLRATNITSFQTIATNLVSTQYTDTAAPAGAAFYRVVAKP